MPGAPPPLVKTEVAEPEEEAADFGGDEEAKPEGAPTRAMPDYGDLVDDDELAVVQGGIKETKEEQGEKGEGAPPRKDAIYVAGVQRLTRNHLAEVFESKDLPVFKWVEWISDNAVLCGFEKVADVAIALRGCEAGFHDVVADDRPGPGLWRAQRFMLDFRQATQADRPAADWKKMHRGGKQVREYRFWEAMKDSDQWILGDGDGAQGMKRALPSGEDAIAAADFDDDSQRRKRLRTGGRPEAEDEDIDLLNRMAAQDRVTLTKEEKGESASLPTTNDGPLVNVKAEDEDSRQSRKKADDNWWGADGGDWWGTDSWGGGGGGAWGDDWGAWGRGRPSRRDSRSDGQGQGGERRQRDDAAAEGGKSRETENFVLDMDDAEKAKRSRRADRFKTPAPEALAASAPVPAKQEA